MSTRLRRVMRVVGPLVMLLVAAASRGAAQYSVFRPAPRASLRELTTDRPDKTESPITVDAGHLQVELDGLTWSYDRPVAGMSVRQWSIAPMNIKVGLLDRLDIQFVVEPSTHERVRIDGGLTENSGSVFGDVTTRVKINIWGDDSGKTAFGIMPFVTSTSVGGHRVATGGLILPLSVALAEGWDFGTMIEADLVADEGKTGRRGVFIASATVGHALSDRLAMYGELYSESSKNTPWIGTFDAGLTYTFGANIQFDAGVNLGVSHAADNVNPFVGFSIRF